MFGIERYNYQAFTKDVLMRDAATDNLKGPRPGERAPDFVGRTLDGDQVHLSEFRGKANVVLYFGSATCPMTASSVRGMDELARSYEGEDVLFLMVYVREAHPGEKLPAHYTIEDKVAAAELLREQEDVEMPIIVDELNGTIHRKYGKVPNPTYIIDKSGHVAFRCLWTKPAIVEKALDELLMIQEETGADEAIVMGGEHTMMPKMMPLAHTARALDRGGRRAVYDFESEMGVPGKMMVMGSRAMRPMAEHPGATLATAGAIAGVITGAIFLGRYLRNERLRRRTPYERDERANRDQQGEDYTAMGI